HRLEFRLGKFHQPAQADKAEQKVAVALSSSPMMAIMRGLTGILGAVALSTQLWSSLSMAQHKPADLCADINTAGSGSGSKSIPCVDPVRRSIPAWLGLTTRGFPTDFSLYQTHGLC